MHLNPWDITLLLVVSAQATLVAYARQPRTKALLVTFPFPFSVAYLALGQPVDATNILGLALLLLFIHGVRWLYVHGKRPIVLAIVGAACLYGLLGGAVARMLPRQEWTFWTACAAVLAVGAVVLRFQPHREEPSHRSSLPVYLKLPIIMAVVIGLILAKEWLRGFMTVFPMVTVVAAYESRHSLWTLTRQFPVLILTMAPVMIAMHLAQPHTGPYGALAIGWLVFAGALPAVEWVKERHHGENRDACGRMCLTRPTGPTRPTSKPTTCNGEWNKRSGEL